MFIFASPQHTPVGNIVRIRLQLPSSPKMSDPEPEPPPSPSTPPPSSMPVDAIHLCYRPKHPRRRALEPESPPKPSMLIMGEHSFRFDVGPRTPTDDDSASSSRNLGRQANPTRSSPSQPPSRGNTSSPSANSASSLYPPNLQQQGQTPSSSGAPPANMTTNEQAQPAGRKPPFFFRDEYAGFIVKGNFMTLAANPLHVESGEWLAHQSTYLTSQSITDREADIHWQSSNRTVS